jgi:hypothetical protein
LHAPVSEGPLRFTFRRWRCGPWAAEVTMPFRIRAGIVGVSAHLWLRSIAQKILGSSCFIIELAPETELKANLQEFFAVARCVHPNLIPVEKAMLAPITEDAPGQLCLRYKAMIDIIDVVDLRPMLGAPPPPPSDGPSSSSAGSTPLGGGPTGRSGPSSDRPQEGGRPGMVLGVHPSPVQPGGRGRSFVDVVVGRSSAPSTVLGRPLPRLSQRPARLPTHTGRSRVYAVWLVARKARLPSRRAPGPSTRWPRRPHLRLWRMRVWSPTLQSLLSWLRKPRLLPHPRSGLPWFYRLR